MRTSKFSISKQLPITSVVSPSTKLAVIEQLERRRGLLGAAEACRILTTHRKTLYERLRSGDLAGVKDHGKWKIDPRVLADYIHRRQLTGTIATHRSRPASSVPRKPVATDHVGVITPQETRSAAEELEKCGLTVESVTVTIPRVIVNCVFRKTEVGEKYDISSLTPGERLVYAQLQNDKRDKEIANALNISFSGVRFHVTNIFRKLGLSGRREILATNHHS